MQHKTANSLNSTNVESHVCHIIRSPPGDNNDSAKQTACFTEGDGLQVDGMKEMGEQRPLQAQHIPA